jgi:hypothetical protein
MLVVDAIGASTASSILISVMKSITRKEMEDLLKTANIRQRFRRDLRFVPEEIDSWEDRDFLTVTDRNNSKGVLIAPFEQLFIVPFELRQRRAGQAGRLEAIVCDFCATWQRGSNSAMITFEREKSSVSFLCCADLLCSFHVRNKTTAAKLSRTQLKEVISSDRRIERLHTKLQQLLSDLS